jgi:hypothetical protein
MKSCSDDDYLDNPDDFDENSIESTAVNRIDFCSQLET